MNNKKSIRDFLDSPKTDEVFGYKDGVCRLTKNENGYITVEYKDNDMRDFTFGVEINALDVKTEIVVKVIYAFIA